MIALGSLAVLVLTAPAIAQDAPGPRDSGLPLSRMLAPLQQESGASLLTEPTAASTATAAGRTANTAQLSPAPGRVGDQGDRGFAPEAGGSLLMRMMQAAR
jgi:hypothetical protein